jgi:hypothetical protein
VISAIALAPFGCRQSSHEERAKKTAAADDVPKVDELDYFQKLLARRPALLENESTCYLSSVLKPRYRAALLEGGSDYPAIVAKHYEAKDQAEDRAWIAAHQQAEVELCQRNAGASGCDKICLASCSACPDAGLSGATTGASLGVYPSGYSLCNFVGYSTSSGLRGGARYDPSGIIDAWKVFFEFRDDFRTTLTPARYFEFSNRLAAAGFRGDSKIFTNPAAPERFRFQYNNLIIHAHSPKDAKLAEKIGLEFFGAALEGRGRGVDVGPPASTVDWHHFLCAEKGNLSRLSDEARDFVRFRD